MITFLGKMQAIIEEQGVLMFQLVDVFLERLQCSVVVAL